MRACCFTPLVPRQPAPLSNHPHRVVGKGSGPVSFHQVWCPWQGSNLQHPASQTGDSTNWPTGADLAELAEREGVEPPRRLATLARFSKPVPSPHRIASPCRWRRRRDSNPYDRHSRTPALAMRFRYPVVFRITPPHMRLGSAHGFVSSNIARSLWIDLIVETYGGVVRSWALI